MKKKTFSKKIIYLNIFIIIVYICEYMAPESIMNYINNPYTNERLLLLFNNSENFSLKPLLNIEFDTLYGFVFLCVDVIIVSIYKYRIEK